MMLMCTGFVVSGIMTFGFVQPDLAEDPILKVYVRGRARPACAPPYYGELVSESFAKLLRRDRG